jgi:hypothetical protein
VSASVETVTGTVTAPPAVSRTVIEQAPGPMGVTVYEAVPDVAFARTVAIVPASGEHVSDSLKTPAYPVSVTVSVTGWFDANGIVVTDACGTAGTGVAVGAGVGVALGVAVGTTGGAELPPPPPHAAHVTAHASAAK